VTGHQSFLLRYKMLDQVKNESESGVIDAVVVSPTESAAGSQSNALEKADDKEFWLTPGEKYALQYFKTKFQKGGIETYPLAPSTQAQLYTLFLNGRTLSEIRQLNPQFGLGQIVDAAVNGNWYQEKLDYQANLLKAARERLQQIGSESVSFLADSLAAAHKQHGQALLRYLQSGNEADLGAFGIGSIRQYKEVLELLLKATGQEKNSTTNLNIKGVVEHVAGESVVGAEVSSKGKSLAQLAAEKKNREK